MRSQNRLLNPGLSSHNWRHIQSWLCMTSMYTMSNQPSWLTCLRVSLGSWLSTGRFNFQAWWHTPSGCEDEEEAALLVLVVVMLHSLMLELLLLLLGRAATSSSPSSLEVHSSDICGWCVGVDCAGCSCCWPACMCCCCQGQEPASVEEEEVKSALKGQPPPVLGSCWTGCCCML